MQYTTEDGIVIWIKSAVEPYNPTQEEIDVVEAFIVQEESDRQNKEAVRIAKRPVRSQINATKASVASATTVPELRTAVSNLMVLLDNVLAFQMVDVLEDE